MVTLPEKILDGAFLGSVVASRGRKNIFWLVTKPFWDKIGCEIIWPECYNISFILMRSDNLFSFLFVQATVTQMREIRGNTSCCYVTAS